MMTLTRKLAVRIVVLFGGFFIVVLAALSVRTYQKEHDDLQEKFGLALERIVATAALEIDGDAHTSIDARDDAANPAFQRVRQALERVRSANYLPQRRTASTPSTSSARRSCSGR
jgi:hypothetical protein